LHEEDELNLFMTPSQGPFVPGSSTNIGDISTYKGLILEWRMNGRSEVFHQFIFLSQQDKNIILGNTPAPPNYPRRYTTILSDGFGTMMWLGVSIIVLNCFYPLIQCKSNSQTSTYLSIL